MDKSVFRKISDRTLGRFRERCITYESQTGTDLLHDAITGLSQEMAVMINADRSLKRMDSMMVASNIRKMSRLELLYICVASLVDTIKKRTGHIPEDLAHYVQKDEQSVEEEDGTHRLCQKGEGMKADCLQNPADPDATYREKAGKQKERVTVTADGAYSGEGIEKAAQANNIEIINTNLTGKEAPDIYADFEFNEEGTRVTACANVQSSKSCSYNAKTGQCTASFHKSQCEGCPYAESCRRKINQRTVRITLSTKSKHRAELQRNRESEEFKAANRFRNGVETVPSFMRRIFNVDRMPVRG